MNIRNNIIVLGLAVTPAFSAGAQMLTPEDYCSPDKSAPAAFKDLRPLADGESFAAISDNGRSIEVFSYKSGLRTGTLFSVDAVKGDLKIDEFDGYEISGNEKKILLWNNTRKIYRHSFTADYYVYDILRSTLSRVTERGPVRGAVMSHDGRMVAYQSENNIYISNIDYKSDIAVTSDGKVNEIIYGTPDWSYEEEFGVLNTMHWNADDSVLAFMRFDESEVPVYSFDEYGYYTGDGSYTESTLYPKSFSYKYPLAGYPNSKVTVLAYDVNNRTTKTMDLPVGSDYVPDMQFDGEGRNLMVMILNRDQNDLSLYKVNPASTVGHRILSETSNAWLSPDAYQMVRYYDKSFVIGSDRSGYRHLYEYDYSGNLLRTLTKGEWNVTAYYGRDPKSGMHFIQNTKRGAINRNVASVNSKGVMTLLNDIDGTEAAAFSSDFRYFVRKYSSALVPTQYTVCNQQGKVVKNLELNEAYAARYASAPRMEFTEVPCATGEMMNAYVIKPADFDPSRKYPLLMYQYNGPDSQLVLNAWKMDGLYYIASQGYIVAAVDGRGTGNRSRSWAHAVYKQLGQLETEDQIAGANAFAKLPYVDAGRMACFGWSYGGYMTLMELSSPDSPFKAGIAMAAVTDWRFYDSFYTERFMLTPQQNESGYRLASAIDKSDRLKGRLLIMSGTSDDNVHFYNTLKYTSKLNFEGKMFDMMVMSGFEHSLRMTNARTRLYSKIVDFLDANLK